jgi:hypothetical protein
LRSNWPRCAGSPDRRFARIDDLALLVDLIASGWSGIDVRLARMERKLDTGGSAQIYRFEEREAS